MDGERHQDEIGGMCSMRGFVQLIGVGPGDPDLVTQKAVKAIRAADVLVYDRLANPVLLDLNRVARRIDVGKKPGAHSKTQDEINAIIVEEALKGNRVARIKGGDPFVFGRGSEEGMVLRGNGIAFEVIPGVSSSIAAPMYAGIPVTHRKVATSFHVITGHEAEGDSSVDYATLAKLKGTLVFLMGFENLGRIVQGLMAGGKSPDTPAAVVMNGTRSNQRACYGKLATLPEEAVAAGLSSPSVIIVGDVVAVAGSLGFMPRERRVILTRESLSNVPLSPIVRNLDLMPVPWSPMTHETVSVDLNTLDMAGRDGIIFTSEKGVQGFFENMAALKMDIRKIPKRVYAVGRHTAACLASYGIHDVAVPDDHECAEGLVRLLAADKGTFLLVRGAYGSQLKGSDLPDGCDLAETVVYDTHFENDGPPFGCCDEDIVFVASPSMVQHMASKTDIRNMAMVCIGDTTAKSAEKHGFVNLHVMDSPDVEAFVSVLENLVQN